jgi:glutathione S-transferase/3-isopropylmalate dehydratase
MITVFGEGRGFRVVWLLEEMGLPYRLRDVDLLAGVENDPEFLKINPAGFIPAIRDGDVTMVESIAIMEYLAGRYGPTPLAPGAQDAAFSSYQQFLHLGEAGLAASIYFVSGARHIAPENERDNWSARQAMAVFTTRLTLVTRQLERVPYMAGNVFTAADISVGYALEWRGRMRGSCSARRSRRMWSGCASGGAISGRWRCVRPRAIGGRVRLSNRYSLHSSKWLLLTKSGYCLHVKPSFIGKMQERDKSC